MSCRICGLDPAPFSHLVGLSDAAQRADAAYLHAHFAVRGCFATRIDRR